MASAAHFALVFVLVLAGALVRLWLLDARSLWFDEAFSWRLVQFPLGEMVERIGLDNHPPLYFLLLKGWVAVAGDSVFALRFPSAVFGTAAVVGTYLFAADVLAADSPAGPGTGAAWRPARGAGALAAALVAVSAFQIRYSCEARMYALAAMLAVFSSWALVRSLRAENGLGWWSTYATSALLLAYTHYYALFTLASQGAFVLLWLLFRVNFQGGEFLRHPVFRYALAAAALVVAGASPWLPVFLRQRGQVQAEYWTRPVDFWDVAGLCYAAFVAPEHGPATPRAGQLLAVDLCALGLWFLRRKARAGDWLVMFLGFGPFALCLLVSAADTKVFAPRYFVMAHMFWLVGLASLVGRAEPAPTRLTLAASALALAVGLSVQFWGEADLPGKPGARAAAAFLAGRRRPGEPVIASSPQLFFVFLYHNADREGIKYFSDGRPVVHYLGAAALKAEDVIDGGGLRTCQARRAWVVDNLTDNTWGLHTVPVPPHWVEVRRRSFPEVFGLGDVTVIEYETTAAANLKPG